MTGTARLAHALRGVALFRDAPARDLVALWRTLTVVDAPAGTILFHRGDPGDRLYVVQSGELEVRLGPDPDSTIRRAGPGDFVGDMALITGRPRTAHVVVAQDAVLWALDRASFQDLVAHSLPLMQGLNQALCDRLERMMDATHERRGNADGGLAGLHIGPYRIVEQIGGGGMAVVYRAIHVQRDTAVALKLLPPRWGTPDLRVRLEREAAALRQLDHPNVVRLLEVGEVEERFGGGLYIAMEWVPQALDRVLRERYPQPLAPAAALHIAHAVAVALACVHAAGLIHRDVKPSNVLVRADGTPALIDFGLVTARATAAEHRLTATNVFVGTADYLSPEQIAGLVVDGRADVYALGVTLYEMLAGHVPFAGRDPLQTLQAHVDLPPPPLPSAVPSAARAVVERALQKRAADRFDSAQAMAVALTEAIDALTAEQARAPGPSQDC